MDMNGVENMVFWLINMFGQFIVFLIMFEVVYDL